MKRTTTPMHYCKVRNPEEGRPATKCGSELTDEECHMTVNYEGPEEKEDDQWSILAHFPTRSVWMQSIDLEWVDVKITTEVK